MDSVGEGEGGKKKNKKQKQKKRKKILNGTIDLHKGIKSTRVVITFVNM